MILVADCSALVALSVCGSLNLLERLFASVVVPETVYVEATRPDKNQAQALKIFLQGKVRQVNMQTYVFLDAYADAGETEAMLLYKQLAADKLLITITVIKFIFTTSPSPPANSSLPQPFPRWSELPAGRGRNGSGRARGCARSLQNNPGSIDHERIL